MVLPWFEIFTGVAIIMLPKLASPSCFHDHDTFGKKIKSGGFSRCTEFRDYMYVGGFQRKQASNDDLRDVDFVKCCQPPEMYRKKPFTIQSADWEMSFDREGWAHCQSGFFLHGVYRGNSHQLKSIRWATCAKPAFHPYWYKDCYDEDLGDGALWECRSNYYVVGIRRGKAETFSSINKLKCCKMYDELLPLKSLEDVKTRVMDVTLNNLAFLANLLGFGWCGGCRALQTGEDFRREGDTWKSNYQEPCTGHMKTDRLKIVYENFSFEVEDPVYSTAERKALEPMVADVGQMKNLDPLSSKFTVTREIKAVRTVYHTTENTFKSGFDASVTVKYTSPSVAGSVTGTFSGSITLSGGNEQSDIEKDADGNIDWDILRVDEPQPVDGDSGVAYQIVTSKNRVDVPYIATVIVKFTARLEGFLRAGAEFHDTHQGSQEEPHVSYTIGSSDSPFYKFLDVVSRRGDRPWLWHQLIQKHPNTQKYIDRLTRESLYKFEVDGKFHEISGMDSYIRWSDLDVSSGNADVNV